MPKTLGGLFGFVLTAVLTVAVGMYVVNRVAPLRAIINGQKAA
jgi:hypothetical protein